ncbi:MAG: site-specific DNA-methyltransferase [Planctomycetaceae bacterium]|nr:site-specific DNA-methyltransferase [Planctomycetaceae bacterium]
MSLATGQIHQGDCISGMQQLAPGSVDLVFADPPFNIGYKYDVYEDRLAADDYLKWSSEWMQAAHRALKDDGTFWLAIGDDFAAELKIEALKAGFHCRSWVIWYYTFGVNCTNKFTRSHTHLFHFVKDRERFTFRADDLDNRVPSARMLVYNDKRGNPNGRLPDDTWIIPPSVPDTFALRPQDLEDCFQPGESDWYFPRIAGTFKERAGFHGCQMPEQLLGRIIRTCSHEGDLVMDPFSGSASTLIVAKKLNRRFVGFELSEDYAQAGTERLGQTDIGTPLTGSPEPRMSAPSTWQGRPNRRTKARAQADAESSQDVGASVRQQLAAALDAAVWEAWKSLKLRRTPERMLADDQKAEQFYARCVELGVPGSRSDCADRLLLLAAAGTKSSVR